MYVTKDTAMLIKREVSDGVIATGYTEEALEIPETEEKGNYNVIQIRELCTGTAGTQRGIWCYF